MSKWQDENARQCPGETGVPTTFRIPPAPYRERAHTKGPGFVTCAASRCIDTGWHIDLWDKGMNKNATWHCACVIAWQFWNAPSSEAYGVCIRAATAKLAVAYGRLQRSIIVSRCFGYGASIGTRHGRSC